MVLSKVNQTNQNTKKSNKKLNATKKRRIRRNRLRVALTKPETLAENKSLDIDAQTSTQEIAKDKVKMSSNDNKSRDDVIAARQAKKLAKQEGKPKDSIQTEKQDTPSTIPTKIEKKIETTPINIEHEPKNLMENKDEVDKAVIKPQTIIEGAKSKDQIQAERAAKKAAKHAKKKGVDEPAQNVPAIPSVKPNEEMTVKDVVETLRDIVNVAKEIQDVTDKVSSIDLGGKKTQQTEEAGKSKAELKAERRAKQEAQRAAKQSAQEQKVAIKPKLEPKPKQVGDTTKAKEASPAPKQKLADKAKVKSGTHRVHWLQHLYMEHDKEALKSIAINSNLHPAIVKLGVQLASKVVTGSNARCVALLDALKKMVRDYTLPAKTEFARGLESHLATSLEFLWAMRPPSASQTNAVKFFRYHLTQLPNNVDEFDAKKTLQEEIDRYIREQIDMAGEAISLAVRKKISNGDNILTYGCSSLIERILREAWEAGVRFRTVVVGGRLRAAGGGGEMLRRLVARGLPCTYVDITALGYVMKTVTTVVVGAGALLGDGSVLGAAGTAQVALAARAHNVPVLVACETHKVTDRVQTDAFVYNEIGDPDDLIDKSDDSSPLKDWRSNPNLTPLNLTYDVTPPNLVTAVVTELAILPCTSAPVVLRFKLSEYGI